MHTIDDGDLQIHHNSDWSGDVRIVVRGVGSDHTEARKLLAGRAHPLGLLPVDAVMRATALAVASCVIGRAVRSVEDIDIDRPK